MTPGESLYRSLVEEVMVGSMPYHHLPYERKAIWEQFAKNNERLNLLESQVAHLKFALALK